MLEGMGINDFKNISIRLMSPEEILKKSHGEIKNPETVNYKSGKPEKDGLFCEKIFGPVRDWSCTCGQYKSAYNANVTCEKCGVDVTKSIVRRERMGHIELECPVIHINFFKANPSILALLLDIPAKTLEKIIYYTAYIVTDPKETGIPRLTVVSEKEYRDLMLQYSKDEITLEIGANAILTLIKSINIEERIRELEEKVANKKNEKLLKQLELFKSVTASGVNPEWIVLKRIPVIPPDVRPMIQINGGRFATTDVNDLYRRLINRNNRLKKMVENDTPEMIIHYEKRLLQEAVDCLFANGKRGKSVTTANNRAYKSLSDGLKGKKGRFRLNLLGKRVDYSGRSVIVVGPELKLNQCGLPKMMALELFRPYIMRELKKRGIVKSYKTAKRMIENVDNRVWDVLEEVIQGRPVLLNRAPTLHRISVQAFEIVLVDGKAIRLHPLVCSAFNADFDGDQMAVHVPLSEHAIKEAYDLMLAPHNILNPKDGAAIAVPSQDMVMGLYYLTFEKETQRPKIFKDEAEAKKAYEVGVVTLRERIVVRLSGSGKRVITTVGKLIFNEIFPDDFEYITENLFDSIDDIGSVKEMLTQKKFKESFGKKGKIKEIINRCYHKYGEEQTVKVLDAMKNLGFKYSTIAGVTVGIDDVVVPSSKGEIINKADEEVAQIRKMYNDGFLTENERYLSTVNLWKNKSEKLTKIMMDEFNRENPIYMMAVSGARGSTDQIKQLASMRGLMTNTVGKIIELPIKNNFKEGIGILDYFTSSHGARKGGVDTALRTADSGYLTRKLIDVAQNIIIKKDDCGTAESMEVMDIICDGTTIMQFEERIVGRYSAEDLTDKNGNLLVAKNELISSAKAEEIVKSGVRKMRIRSPLTCECKEGFCRKCYGIDLSNWQPVKLGTAVGIIAAQSIGEPGTQLTMKTFHTGGIAGSDITEGLPRVEELFEAQVPDVCASIAPISGNVTIVEQEKNRKIIIANEEAKWSVEVPMILSIKVKNNDFVEVGTILTSGSLELQKALDILGKTFVQNYILNEIEKVYKMQGVKVDTKHIEIIIRQMLRKFIVENAGDSKFLQGTVVDIEEYKQELERLKLEGKELPVVSQRLTGIKKVALTTDSFLSAASFQETMKILTEAAIRGKTDNLRGLKENLIVGKLIPCGTGFKEEE